MPKRSPREFCRDLAAVARNGESSSAQIAQNLRELEGVPAPASVGLHAVIRRGRHAQERCCRATAALPCAALRLNRAQVPSAARVPMAGSSRARSGTIPGSGSNGFRVCRPLGHESRIALPRHGDNETQKRQVNDHYTGGSATL
jgi:hypothetical protein